MTGSSHSSEVEMTQYHAFLSAETKGSLFYRCPCFMKGLLAGVRNAASRTSPRSIVLNFMREII